MLRLNYGNRSYFEITATGNKFVIKSHLIYLDKQVGLKSYETNTVSNRCFNCIYHSVFH